MVGYSTFLCFISQKRLYSSLDIGPYISSAFYSFSKKKDLSWEPCNLTKSIFQEMESDSD